MNPITNQEPLAKLEKFRGLWHRGSYDTCPPDHLTDCYNCSFPANEQLTIRERFTIQNAIPGRQIISFAIAQVPAGPILLTLNNDGTFRDETHGGTILIGVSTADDFAILNIFGRTYVTFKQKGRAYPDSPIYVYDGVTFRPTGWPVPTSAPSLSESTVGIVDPGYHSAAVVFQSPSGYLSGIGPTVAIASTGSHNILVSGIPIGPAGTVARWILMTRANESELMFVPGGVIEDNTTTTFNYNLTDSALISSADYLRDIYNELPGCAALKFYRGRMVCIGKYDAPDDILISRQQDPETVSLVENVVHLPVNYGISTSVGGLVIRAVLYVTKPNATYSVQDNGDNPNTWAVDCVDSGIGAYDVGLSQFASDMSAQDVVDSSLVCNKRGLIYFTGQYVDVPLTFKIESLWEKISENQFYNVQIAHDVWNKRVYIAVPLDPPLVAGNQPTKSVSGYDNMILMMDYKEGLHPQSVQWSTWTGYNNPFRKIGVENFTLTSYGGTDMIYQLACCSGGPNIWKLNPPIGNLPQLPDDLGLGLMAPIWQYITTAPVSGTQGVYTFNMLDLSLGGYGQVIIKLFENHRTLSTQPRGFQLEEYGSMDLQRLINFVSESMMVMLIADQTKPDGVAGYLALDSIRVFGTPTWNMRPAYTQRF